MKNPAFSIFMEDLKGELKEIAVALYAQDPSGPEDLKGELKGFALPRSHEPRGARRREDLKGELKELCRSSGSKTRSMSKISKEN